jgi:hypothetical protein
VDRLAIRRKRIDKPFQAIFILARFIGDDQRAPYVELAQFLRQGILKDAVREMNPGHE